MTWIDDIDQRAKAATPGRRVVVCNTCGRDWGIQHCCDRTGFGNTNPTVIFETSDPSRIDIPRLVTALRKAEETMVNVRSEMTHAKENIDTDWCINQICAFLSWLEAGEGE